MHDFKTKTLATKVIKFNLFGNNDPDFGAKDCFLGVTFEL
jgi:hypothetical protein